jgi:uncharacterized protein (UPF0248 family)
MTPIHELLNRIRWDRDFGAAAFELGYLDRFERTIHRVALPDLAFPEGEHRTFEFTDDAGETRRVPLHRVRQVWRNGELIWQRPG